MNRLSKRSVYKRIYRWQLNSPARSKTRLDFFSAMKETKMLTRKSQNIIFVTSAEKWLVWEIKYCCPKCVYLFKLRKLLHPYKQMLNIKTNLTQKHWCRRLLQRRLSADGWFVHSAVLANTAVFPYHQFLLWFLFYNATKENFLFNVNTVGAPETNFVKFFKLFKVTIFLAKHRRFSFFWPVLFISSTKL